MKKTASVCRLVGCGSEACVRYQKGRRQKVDWRSRGSLRAPARTCRKAAHMVTTDLVKIGHAE